MSAQKTIVFSILFPILSACGEGGIGPLQGDAGQLTDSGLGSMSLATATNIANAYCGNQRKLQLISASLLSAYSPKGNGSDTANCGGENVLTEDGPNFSLQLNNYCVVNRGQQFLLNGSIDGATESGNNFTSTINNLSIQGNGIDLSISGDSYAGRADDNFVNLHIIDNATSSQLDIDNSSVKKGEFDFGDFNLPTYQTVPFQFITHFNETNTEGLLFFYGTGEDKIIVSGDNGMITAVYSADRHDSGTWLDLPCNN